MERVKFVRIGVVISRLVTFPRSLDRTTRRPGQHYIHLDLAFSSMRANLWSMIGENRQLVPDELVEVQDCRRITNRFRGIYRIYPNLMKQNRRMSTCNWLDLQTLGSPLIMPKKIPHHCLWCKRGRVLSMPMSAHRPAKMFISFETLSLHHLWYLVSQV